MAEEELQCPECKKGAPDWMVTFSDLMSLLLTFFVLLLSMSTVSDPKYEEAAESLKQAFTSTKIIGSTPKVPVAIEQTDPANKRVQVDNDERDESLSDLHSETKKFDDQSKIEMVEIVEKLIQENIAEEVDSGIAEIEQQQSRVLIRFPAEATFESGSAVIKPKMLKVLKGLSDALKELDVKAVINGHTDDDPISTAQFRSNWDLSSARAGSVAMVFQEFGKFSSQSIEIIGHADGKPIVPNDTRENKEKNRRIELFVEPHDESFTPQVFQDVIDASKPVDPNTDLERNKRDELAPLDLDKPKVEKKDTLTEDQKDSVEAQKKIDNILNKIKNFNKGIGN